MKNKNRIFLEKEKLLKNKNFRNNQNYIVNSKTMGLINRSFDDFEKDITLKLYGVYMFILFLGMFLLIYSEALVIFIMIIALPGFAFISSFKQFLTIYRRKKIYFLCKLNIKKSNKLDNFLILKKKGGKIITEFYE